MEKKLNLVNYVVSTPGRRKPHWVCHVNMLKHYFEREPANPVRLVGTVSESPSIVESDEQDEPADTKDPEGQMPPVKLSNSDVLLKIDVELQHLPAEHRDDVKSLVFQFKPMCSDAPGLTTRPVHDADVRDTKPMKQHPYQMNPEKATVIKQKVQYTLENGLIEPSQSNYNNNNNNNNSNLFIKRKYLT